MRAAGSWGVGLPAHLGFHLSSQEGLDLELMEGTTEKGEREPTFPISPGLRDRAASWVGSEVFLVREPQALQVGKDLQNQDM